MSDKDLRELLQRRIEIVARLAQATSQLQKWRQVCMAANLDLLRCEMFEDPAAQELQQEGRDAESRVEEAESSVARCEALIDEMEQGLAETDREIEAMAAR